MTIEIQHRVGNGDLCELCRKPLPARVLVQTERSGEETLYHVECFPLAAVVLRGEFVRFITPVRNAVLSHASRGGSDVTD